MRVKCDFCDNYIDDSQEKCPNCGAPNNHLKRTVSGTPKTIEQLKQWYKDHNLPPEETTRFFIGKNYKGARAFGIYKDGDNYIVYKNKTDGTRAVRYEGTDEAYAVNELYMKLKSEIVNQKDYNAGKGKGSAAKSAVSEAASAGKGCLGIAGASVGLLFLVGLGVAFAEMNFQNRAITTLVTWAIVAAIFAVLSIRYKKKGKGVTLMIATGVIVAGIVTTILSFFNGNWNFSLAAGLVGAIIESGGIFYYIRQLQKHDASGRPLSEMDAESKMSREGKKPTFVAIIITLVICLAIPAVNVGIKYSSKNNGYYQLNNTTYYKHGSSWFAYMQDDDDDDYYWTDITSTVPSELNNSDTMTDYFSSSTYLDSFDATNFEDSQIYDDYYGYDSSSSSDSDYSWDSSDSWDSGSTDFSSDW